jgi:TolB-like protein
MEPTPDHVRAQLDRILASPGFASADRVSRFLRYVVERSLAGEADQLKEYVIGLEVFDRNQDYDPRLDSIVRVEAGRLRAKIDEYYNSQGRDDAVLIQMRRGSYGPVFEHRHPSGSVAATRPAAPPARRSGRRLAFGVVAAALGVAAVIVWRAGTWATVVKPAPTETIAVLPFSHYSTDPADQILSARMTDGVTSELARLDTLSVVSHTSASQFAGVRKPLREVAQALGASLILEGTVTRDAGRLRVQVRLVDAATDRKLWVEDFEGTAAETVQLQRRIAEATSAAVAGRRKRSLDRSLRPFQRLPGFLAGTIDAATFPVATWPQAAAYQRTCSSYFRCAVASVRSTSVL